MISLVYIVFARFELLSFNRNEKYVRPAAEKMLSISEQLEVEMANLWTEIKKSFKSDLPAWAKVSIFISSMVFGFSGTTFYLFLSIMRKVFINLLIGWKALNLGSLSVMFSKFIQLVEQLTAVFQIPPYVIRGLMYPLILICQLAELFDIDLLYDLLTVTCEGAKSPIELFIDSFVLGVAILFINSKYNFLWSITLQEMNRLLTVKYWIGGRTVFSKKFFLSLIAFVLTSTNPFITVLRFFLSYVNFGVFFANNHVTHKISEACIGIEGFQNQELWLVNSTSVLVWWLMAPILYSTAEIVCPKGGYTAAKMSLFNVDDANKVIPLKADEGSYIDMDSNLRECNSLSAISRRQRSVKISIGEDAGCQDSTNNENYSMSSGYDSPESMSSGYDSPENLSENDEASHIGSFLSSSAQELDGDGETHMEGSPNGENAVHVQQVNTKLSYLAVMGMLRYTWSHVVLVFSTDLLIVYTVNAWVTLIQQWKLLEQRLLLRSDRRWGAHIIEDSIKRFHTRSIKTDGWAEYLSFFHAYEVAARETDKTFNKKWVDIAFKSETSKLPPYYRLCLMVQTELIAKLKLICYFRHISMVFAFVIAFSGVGHLLTIVGRKYWGIVTWKYSLFACACVGLWTDEIYEAYEIEELVREFTITDPDDATILFIPLAIASRAILLQALGETSTLISIVVINLCGAPLFVFSPKLRKNIPPLIHLNPREVAIKRERIELLGLHKSKLSTELVHFEEWVIRMRSISIFFTESRLLVFFSSLVSLSLTIILLKGIEVSKGTLALLLMGMVPYFIGSALIAMIYVGKRLKLTDNDFKVVFSGWLRPPACMQSSRVQVSTGIEQEDMAREPENVCTNSIDIDISDDSSLRSDLIAPIEEDSGSWGDSTHDNYSVDSNAFTQEGGGFRERHFISIHLGSDGDNDSVVDC